MKVKNLHKNWNKVIKFLEDVRDDRLPQNLDPKHEKLLVGTFTNKNGRLDPLNLYAMTVLNKNLNDYSSNDGAVKVNKYEVEAVSIQYDKDSHTSYLLDSDKAINRYLKAIELADKQKGEEQNA